jgi:imidazolonepropionase-like amidohydrolase
VRLRPNPLIIALSFALAAPAALAQAPAAPAKTALRCGALIDVDAGRKLGPHTIVVSGDRIAEVRAGHDAVDGATVVDLPGHTCMPGLMDMHVHITDETSKEKYSEGFRLNPPDYAFRSVVLAERTLLAGFTTVRHLGDDGVVSVSLRNAIAQGLVKGPRIYTSGKSIATTGGHADPTNGWARRIMGDPGPVEGVVNSPEEARKAVRQRYKESADLIKITATGGVLSFAKNGQNPQFTVEEVKAIVDTARDYGFKVAAHAHGDDGARRAVLAGVDSIEHGTYLSDETMRLMKEKGTWYVPTISAGVFVGEMAQQPGYYPEIVRPKALAVGPLIQKTAGRAYKAGVKMAFGTDAGVFPHGLNAREFELLVGAGVPPMVAIQSATINAAQLLGEEATLGTVTAGKLADVVAVEGDPLEDITRMKSMAFVMKNGVVYKSP